MIDIPVQHGVHCTRYFGTLVICDIWEQELISNLFSSRQMMEDHGDKPFGVMERLTREKEEAARKLREEQDQREKEEEERRMKEMLCKQNEGPGSASSSRQRIRAILEKQKRQRVRV